MLDQIFPQNITYLEEVLFDCPGDKPMHVLLSSLVVMVRRRSGSCGRCVVDALN
ncbi:hypothetical protein R2359_18655 [Mycobacteroides chelonae]|nr:hypothetical protein [Mycobacteroides chelonae]